MATPTKIKLPLPPHLQAAEDLIMWRNPLHSGAALAAITALYLLLEWSRIPLLPWASNLLLLLVLGTLVWGRVAVALHKPMPAEVLPPFLTRGVDEATVRSLAERVRVALNKVIAVVGRILSGTDPALSLRAAAVIFAVGWAGRLMSPLGLLYTAVLAAFSLPKAYEMRKDEVDGAVATARRTLDEQYVKLSAQATDLYSKITPRKAPPPPSTPTSSTSFTPKDD